MATLMYEENKVLFSSLNKFEYMFDILCTSCNTSPVDLEFKGNKNYLFLCTYPVLQLQKFMFLRRRPLISEWI